MGHCVLLRLLYLVRVAFCSGLHCFFFFAGSVPGWCFVRAILLSCLGSLSLSALYFEFAFFLFVSSSLFSFGPSLCRCVRLCGLCVACVAGVLACLNCTFTYQLFGFPGWGQDARVLLGCALGGLGCLGRANLGPHVRFGGSHSWSPRIPFVGSRWWVPFVGPKDPIRGVQVVGPTRGAQGSHSWGPGGGSHSWGPRIPFVGSKWWVPLAGSRWWIPLVRIHGFGDPHLRGSRIFTCA